MAYEDLETGEKPISRGTTSSKAITFKEAIELGEYDPKYLANFPEWHTLSEHVQFQYIRTAIDNRNRQLVAQWAEINNMLDFRLKPQLAVALKNIEKQIKKMDSDKEELYLEYSK
jgi:hypothetical protein